MKTTFASIKHKLLKIHASIEQRMLGFQEDTGGQITKIAFDHRRIDQEGTFNPRRALQHYQRSEPFIDDKMADKIQLMFKVKTAADLIQQDFYGDPDWLDSKTRILCNAVNNVLRTEQKDYDFSKKQLDYLDELLYMRYRLKEEDIAKMSEMEIKNAIINKDERLLHKSIYAKYNNGAGIEKTSDQPVKVIQHIDQRPEDTLIEKLFGSVKASKENKDVQRSITITINDKINDQIEEKKKEKSGIEEK